MGIKYNTGVSDIGYLKGESLEDGYSVSGNGFDEEVFRCCPGDDDSGSTFEGDLYERRMIGIGRPRGNER